MYLPPEGYTAFVPRFEIDGAEEEGGGGGGTGNDRSGVVKIERADRESQPRELWRAIEPCRAEPSRSKIHGLFVLTRPVGRYRRLLEIW